MFENKRNRSTIKPGQLKAFELNENENYLDQSSNKENIFNGKNINRKLSTNDQFTGNVFNLSNKKIKENDSEEIIDNFTSPEPYNFYLHNNNSDLSNHSTQTYNRVGSKNYFVSETPTPFLYNDIVNKGRLNTDTTKKNKPTTISNSNTNNTQNQKFYSNSYGLNLDKNEQDDDYSSNENNNKQDYTQSIWSVSPPFSATRTEDTNLEALIEKDEIDEIEKNQDIPNENSLYNSSSFAIHHENDNTEQEPSNIDLYDQEEPITYHNDFQADESNEFIESHSYQFDKLKDSNLNNKFYFSSSASSSKNPSRRNSLSIFNTEPSAKSIPKAKSVSSLNQINESHSHSNYDILTHSRSLTSPMPFSSNTKNNVLKNRINKNKSTNNNNTNSILKKNNVLANSSCSSINPPSFSSTLSTKEKPKISSVRKSIIGNYYSLMEKNKIGNAHKRLNSFKYNNKEKQKQQFFTNDNPEILADEDFYYDSDSNQEEILNKKYSSKVSYRIIGKYKYYYLIKFLYFIIIVN